MAEKLKEFLPKVIEESEVIDIISKQHGLQILHFDHD